MTHRIVASLCALLALNGCGPVDEEDPSAAPAATQCLDEGQLPTEAMAIEVGYLDESAVFHALTDGMAIEKQFGFQGGSHVDLAARIYGYEGDVEFSIADGQGFMVSSEGAVPSCDGWAESQARVFDPPTGDGMTFTVRLIGSDDLTETLTVDIR